MDRPSTSSSFVGHDAREVGAWYWADDESKPVTPVLLCRQVELVYPRDETRRVSNGPVATCSYNYRYAANAGDGALKYQPVQCSAIHQPDVCQVLRRNRGGGGRIHFTFELKLPPRCRTFERKVMVVPSIGCPQLLGDLATARQLLWAARADGRPTFLSVHASEADAYMQSVGEAMKHLGVGIVAWTCEEHVLGFGVSRLAAQQFGRLCGGARTEVVMCDVNVLKPTTKSLKSGYGTDDEDKTYRPRSRQGVLFYASGKGTGVPMHGWESGKLTDLDADEGGDGRPLEQLVVVDGSLSYDPCFVMSSEDANLTHEFLARENKLRGRKPYASEKTFRAGLKVKKVLVGGPTCHQYGKLLASFLDGLGEDDVLITYTQRDEEPRNMRVGELAFEIAYGNHLTRQARGTPPKKITHTGYTPVPEKWDRGLAPEDVQKVREDARRIRSLIVEQILLKHLQIERQASNDARMSDGEEDGNEADDESEGEDKGKKSALKPLRKRPSPGLGQRKPRSMAARSSSSSAEERQKKQKQKQRQESDGNSLKRERSPTPQASPRLRGKRVPKDQQGGMAVDAGSSSSSE